jgi:hypothetical protein
VAFSQSRKKRKPDIHWREAYMQRFSPARSAADWIGLNLAMETLTATGSNVTRDRYEDLATDPLRWLRKNLPGVPFDDGLREGRVSIGVSHTVSGNPLRFQKEEIVIRTDDEWRTRMRRRDRRIVTATTLPLLVRYGYV